MIGRSRCVRKRKRGLVGKKPVDASPFWKDIFSFVYTQTHTKANESISYFTILFSNIMDENSKRSNRNLESHWMGNGTEMSVAGKVEGCNLLSFLLRCGTRLHDWGTQWDSWRFANLYSTWEALRDGYWLIAWFILRHSNSLRIIQNRNLIPLQKFYSHLWVKKKYHSCSSKRMALVLDNPRRLDVP